MGHLTAALAKKRGETGLPTTEDSASDSKMHMDMDRGVRPRLVTRSRLLIVATLALLTGSLSYSYAKFAKEPTSRIATDRIRISEVKSDLFQDFIPVTGTFVPENTVVLDAINGGQISQIYVEEGAFVVAGQRLIELSNPTLQLEVIGREAQLAEQINNLSVTQLSMEQNQLSNRRDLIEIDYRIERLGRELDRFTALLKAGAVTQAEFDETETELNYQVALRDAVAESQRVNDLAQSTHIETLQMSVTTLNQNIEIVRDNLDNLTLTAPIDGQITSLEAELGETKGEGEQLIKIDQIDSFKISALIDEFYLTRVQLGQFAIAEINGESYKFTITKIYPEVHNRQFEIDLVSESLPNTIRAGQSLRLRLEIGSPAQTLLVANGAFYDATGGTWVFAIDENNLTASRREVQLGRRNSDFIEIVSGLSEGDQVITSSYSSFGEAEKLLLN